MPATAVEPFLELIPTKGDPHRCYRWEPLPDGMWRVGVLTIDAAGDTTTYELDETAAEYGRAFTLRKLGGAGFVCVDVRGFAADHCDCKGFEFSKDRTCRHLAAVLSLIANEQL